MAHSILFMFYIHVSITSQLTKMNVDGPAEVLLIQILNVLISDTQHLIHYLQDGGRTTNNSNVDFHLKTGNFLIDKNKYEIILPKYDIK